MDTLRNLEVRHLIALEAVARTGTFGRAAADLGYTQSAVSQQIAAFERMLGSALFDRPGGPRPVTLTPLGERMLEHARSIIGRVEQAAADLGTFRDGHAGRIRIGTFESISTGLLPAIVGALIDERPQVDVALRDNTDNDELVGWLRDGQIDVSFVIGENGDPGELASVHLVTDPYVVVGRIEDMPDGPVRPDDLIGARLVGEHPGFCADRIEHGLRAHGVEPSYAFRSNDNGAMIAMARAGLGLAIMPRMAIDRDDPGLAIRDLDPGIEPRDVRIAWMAGRTLSPVARRFVALACDHCGVDVPEALLDPAA